MSYIATFTLTVHGREHTMGTLRVKASTMSEALREVEAFKAKTGMGKCTTTFSREATA